MVAPGGPSLAVAVVTAAGGLYSERVERARSTWARGLPGVLFVAAEANASLGVEPVACGDDHLRGMCCKTVAAIRMALERFPSARWLVRAVDDTFVFVRNLERELEAYNPAALLYLGAASVSLLCHFRLHAASCAEAHAGGGAGVVLSRPLAELLVRHARAFLANCSHDDVHLGHFLRHAFDVHVTDLPGALQEPRVERLLGVGRSGEVERCPRVLPFPVYSRIEDWGQLHPLAPMDASRLVLVHSDPAAWPQLAELPALASSLPSGVGLMAFADHLDEGGGAARGRRVQGPHFEGRPGRLGLCAHAASWRLAGFAALAARPPDKEEALPLLATLHWAAWRGHAAVAAELCAGGADADQLGQLAGVQEFFRPLHLAAYRGHLAVVDALLAGRAEPAPRTALAGATPLDMALDGGQGASPAAERLRAAAAAAATTTS